MNPVKEVLAGSIMLVTTINGCAMRNNPSVEYNEGVLTVAADPTPKTARVRKVTREQVIAQLGANFEGGQKDGSYVICADMSQVYACPDGSCMEEADKARLAGRFELLLLDQAASLLFAGNCGPNEKSGWSAENRGMDENSVKGLSTYKKRAEGDYVCLWTTRPEEIRCK